MSLEHVGGDWQLVLSCLLQYFFVVPLRYFVDETFPLLSAAFVHKFVDPAKSLMTIEHSANDQKDLKAL